jgi:hypothetical protein
MILLARVVLSNDSQIGHVTKAVIAQLAARRSHAYLIKTSAQNPPSASKLNAKLAALMLTGPACQDLLPKAEQQDANFARRAKLSLRWRTMIGVARQLPIANVQHACQRHRRPNNRNVNPGQRKFKTGNRRCRWFVKGRVSRAVEEDMLQRGAYDHMSIWTARSRISRCRGYRKMRTLKRNWVASQLSSPTPKGPAAKFPTWANLVGRMGSPGIPWSGH